MIDQRAYNNILIHMESGRIQQALVLIKTLTSKHPLQASYWHLYSMVSLQLQQSQCAIKHAKKAINLEKRTDFNIQLALSFQRNLNFIAALEIADSVIKTPINDAHNWNALGNIYSGCNETITAEKMYQKAVDLQPNIYHFLFNLATALRANGKLEQAELTYDSVIAMKPDDYEAFYNRSQLSKKTKFNNNTAAMELLFKQKISHWRDEVYVCFALAKEYEDLQKYSQAIAYLKRGCDLKRQKSNYRVEGDIQAIEQIINTFDNDFIQSDIQGCQSSEPVFILGLPRTGTTLVERILSSHSNVFSVGESQNFSAEMVALIAKHWATMKAENKFHKSEMISASLDIDHLCLGQSYVDNTRPFKSELQGKTHYFIDKHPLNYLYIGLIAKALPNAKIIHLTRHPLDACFAIYKTLFKDAYPFSYCLNDLGRYYLAYHKLMQHWQKVLPEKILNVSYEQLVNHQHDESRKIIEYCGLNWQEQCLNFHENTQSSTTASASQIRQPIYTTSIDKWRHFDTDIQPLIALFKEQGIKM